MAVPRSNVPTPPNQKVVGTRVMPTPTKAISQSPATTVPTPPKAISQTPAVTSTPSAPMSVVPTPPKGISTTAATTSTPSIPTSSVPMPPQSNYRQELDNLLNQYRDLANTQFNYNPQTDPRYQAYQQLAQGRANEAARVASQNTLETMNDRGIINSSVTSNQLGQIEHRARQNAELEALAAVPQFYDQAYNQYQGQLNNLGNLINMYAGQDDTMFNRDQAMFNRGITEAQLTGQYIPSQAQPIINQLMQLKQEAERPDLGAETYAAYRAQGDQLRNQLRAMGVDTSWIDSNVTSSQAAQNIPNAFATLDARNQQFNQNMAERQFNLQNMETMAQLTGFMPDGRPTTAQQQRDLQNAWATIDALGYVPENLSSIVGIPPGTRTQAAIQQAIQNQFQQQQIAISQQNANTSRYNAETSRLDADRRYNQYQDAQNQPTPTTESDYVSMIEQIPDKSQLSKFFEEERAGIIRDIGIAGYNRLKALYAPDNNTSQFNFSFQNE